MKTRLVAPFLIAAVIVTNMTGCMFSNEYVDPLDVVYTVGEKEVTIRNLFEASQETLAYANYLGIEGEYSYVYNSGTYSSEEKYGCNYSYDCYMTDTDNYTEVFTGNAYHQKNRIVSYYGKGDTSADYIFYTEHKNGEISEKIQYSGDRSLAENIDVRSLLFPDFSNLDMWLTPGTEQIIVTLKGKMEYANKAFGNWSGAKYISEAVYYFSVENNNLIYAYFRGNNTSDMVTSAKISVIDVNYKDGQTFEVPSILHENSEINAILTDEVKLPLNSEDAEVVSLLDIQNDWITEANTIWDAVVQETGDAISFSGLNDSMQTKASEMEMELKKGYCVYQDDEGFLIRYTFFKDGSELGKLFVPFCIDNKEYVTGRVFAVSAEDYFKIDGYARMEIIHEQTENRRVSAVYRLDKRAGLDIMVHSIRQDKLSDLSEDENLVWFYSVDRENLKNMAKNYEYARYTPITMYEIYENGNSEQYYVIETTDSIKELKNTYELPLASQDSIEKELKRCKVGESMEFTEL